MSRCYWLPVLALVGLVVAAHAQQPGNGQGGSSRLPKVQQAPQAQAQPTISPALQDSLDGIRSALESANKKKTADDGSERAKQDLDAQLRMARAADKMFIVGVAETAITFTGVLLVLGTLIYSKKAADAARDAVKEAQAATIVARENLALIKEQGVQDLRAWVSIDLDLVKVSRSAENAHFTVKISLKNIGKTPALNVGVTTKIWPSNGFVTNRGPQPVPAQFPSGMTPLLPGADTSERFGLRMSNKEISAAIEEARKEGCSVMVTIDAIVHYQTIFDVPGAPRHMTSIRYHAHHREYDPSKVDEARTWLVNGPQDTTQVLFAKDRDAPTLMD